MSFKNVLDETANFSEKDQIMLQTIILTFNDDTKAFFTGKAVCYPPDTKKIRNIQFTEPKELPEGYSFEEVK